MGILIASTFVGCAARSEPRVPPIVRTTSATIEPRAADVPPEPEEPPGPPPRDAERVIASLRPKFRACFERGRADDHPNMKGKVVLVTRIGLDGSVQSTRISDRAGLSRTVADCIAEQMTHATFSPRATPATFEVPVRFIDSGR